MCGDGPHAPSGPPWTLTTAGGGVAPAPEGEAIQTSIGPPPPAACTTCISGISNGRCQRDPSAERVRAVWPDCVSGPSPRPTVTSSIARVPSVPRKATVSAPTAIECVTPSVDVSARQSTAVPSPSTVNSHGCERPRSEIVATILRSPAQNGPWRPYTNQPVRSVSGQFPTGRSRPGASSRGGREPLAGPIITPGLISSSGSSSSTPWAAIHAPSGDQAGLVAQPPGARTSRGSAFESSTSTAQIVGRGWRSGSGPRSLEKAIVWPSGCQAISDTPVPSGDLARPAGRRFEDE